MVCVFLLVIERILDGEVVCGGLLVFWNKLFWEGFFFVVFVFVLMWCGKRNRWEFGCSVLLIFMRRNVFGFGF